jgi:formate-dependent nitrite reductase membrane component NrfD
MFVSWLIILVLKGGFHIAHAERPLTVWRMILRPRTSWISRGLILTLLLIVFGAIQLPLTYWAPDTAVEILFKVLAGIAAFGIITYTGFTMNYVNGIPLWNSALLPALFMLWGILSGLALVMAIGVGDTGADIGAVVAGSIIVLIAMIVLTAFYLWSANYAGPSSKESIKELTQGSPALILGIGVIIIGMVVPLILSLWSFFSDTSPALSVGVVFTICEIIGGLAFTYIVLKVGVYSPIVPART